MLKRNWVWIAVGVVAAAMGGYAAYRQFCSATAIPEIEMVSKLPADATTVVYVDLAALRQSTLLAGLRAFSSEAPTEKEYADFVRESGFDYERDLDRAAVAVKKDDGSPRIVYALAEGRFDIDKITMLALRSGKKERQDGREVFTVAVGGDLRPLYFTFPRKGAIALTEGGDLGPLLAPRGNDLARAELVDRARRLAGSPVFIILRPSRGTFDVAAYVSGRVHSAQLAALVAQLRWISIAARLDGERTKIVLEGESLSEDAMRQLAGALETLRLAAEMALNDPKARARMDPAEYAALADLLKTAEVTRLDRGETKSVRVILSAGPELWASLLRKPAAPIEPPEDTPAKKRDAARKKGKN